MEQGRCPINGANSADLFLNNAQFADAGTYTVTVTNCLGGAPLTSAPGVLTVVAPATTSPPALPTIPAAVFDVKTYGALGDGQTDNTIALQNALNAATAAGGGTVRVRAAARSYLSGSLTMGSNTNLQIDYGAVLQMLPFDSSNPAAPRAGYYPISGMSYPNFITAKNAHDVAITGAGTLDGQGAAWWDAYSTTDGLPHRPRLINMGGMTRLLVTGVSLTNSPSFHLCPSATDMTVVGVTVSALAANALNTDGMDVSGTHLLIQNCSVADGDDDIVLKPGSTFCSDITIANCAIGAGHGLSVGGGTQQGLNGMNVTNCTFNSTTIGLRMKADSTQGGPVQNVSYSNITMTNVVAPIVFFSYYAQIGGGSPSYKITPTVVNSWNGDGTTNTASSVVKTPNQPINPLNTTTLPAWRNITINNLTATGASAYSSLWGLPLADYLVSNVVLNNVSISGGAGFYIYDATNVQFTGTANVGTITACNSLAITGQPQSWSVNQGTTATFKVTAVGASGLGSAPPTYRWSRNGTPLANGPAADGSSVTGATTATLTVGNVQPDEAGSYTATVSNALDGYDVNRSLLVGNSLPVSATSSAATLTVATNYGTWAAGFGLNAQGNGAANADPDGDGIPNLLEFVLGGNPTVSNRAILPTATLATVNGVPSLIYQLTESTAAAAAVGRVAVEYSTDLATWTTAADSIGGVSVTTVPLSGTIQQVTVTIPCNGQPRVFTRLRITP